MANKRQVWEKSVGIHCLQESTPEWTAIQLIAIHSGSNELSCDKCTSPRMALVSPYEWRS